VDHKTPFSGHGSRNAAEDWRPNILQLKTERLTADKISVIEQLAHKNKAFIIVLQETLKVVAHSDPVKRWDFRKADWKRFCLFTDESVERLPPPDTSNIEMAYQDFCESLLYAGKQCIPRVHRKNSVSCWNKECETLWTDSDRDASSLLSRLVQKKQERWEEAENPIDFSHSSCMTLRTINKLTGRSARSFHQWLILANSIASRLAKNGAHRSGIASPSGWSARSCPAYGRFQHLRVTVSLNSLGGWSLLLPSIAWSQESLRDWTPSTLCFCFEPKYLGVTLDRSYRQHWVISQEAEITHSAPETACWLQLGCWSNNSKNSHPSLGELNCRALRACLMPQCSYPPHRPRHQQRLANCDWMPASYTSGKPSNSRRHQPAELHCSGATLYLARRAMEPGHLLYSALTRPSSAVARRLKSRHPFVSSAQNLISSSDNNIIGAARWTDRQWTAECTHNPTRLRIFIPDTGTPPEWASQEEHGPGYPPPHRCRTFPLLFVEMGYGLLCGLSVWRRRTKRWPCCSPMSNPSTSPWTAWFEGSGRHNNRMAAEHLPRDLLRPSSGLNNSLKRRRRRRTDICAPLPPRYAPAWHSHYLQIACNLSQR